MRLLYIVGNGLDIAHHMKTSYQDFFKYYLGLSSVDGVIKAMKKDIDSNKYETWADLEIGLGQYASKCSNKDIFLKCLWDIKENLRIYLQKESEKINTYKIGSFTSFCNPRLFLDPEPKIRYEAYINGLEHAPTQIDVITLNYTNTLELLLGYKSRVIGLTPNVTLNSIMHIHGTLDNMMVMGVNDSSQINNESLNTDIDIIEDFVKPEFNDACMNNKNRICESLIINAHVIVVYGSSLGQSDNKWWQLIGRRISQQHTYPLLVYLPFDNKKNQTAEPNHLRRWTLQSVREIQEKFDVKLDVDTLSSRMCVAFNKRLFSIVKSTQ